MSHIAKLEGLDNRISSDIKVETKKSAKTGKDYKTLSFSVAMGNGWIKDEQGNFKQRQADFARVVVSPGPNKQFIIDKLEKKATKGMIVQLKGIQKPYSNPKGDGTYDSGYYILVDGSDGNYCEVFDIVKNKSNAATATDEVEVPSAEDVQNVGNEMDIDISADDLPF